MFLKYINKKSKILRTLQILQIMLLSYDYAIFYLI